MSRFTRFSPILIIAATMGACWDAPVDRKAEGEKLMQLSRDWSNVAASGDLEAIMAGWADDAVMMVPGLPALEGKPAIREYVEAASQMPGFSISWEPVSAHVSKSGDMAYLLERNRMTMNDDSGNTVTTYGKVVTIWRKGPDDTWKNVVDMWNEAPREGAL